MNGALQANGSLVSTPVGRMTKAAFHAENQIDAARQKHFLVNRDHTFLTDFVEGFSRKRLWIGLDQQYPSVRRAWQQEPTRSRHRPGAFNSQRISRPPMVKQRMEQKKATMPDSSSSHQDSSSVLAGGVGPES